MPRAYRLFYDRYKIKMFQDDEQACFIEFEIIIPVINVILAIFIICCMFKYIKAKQTVKNTQLYYLGLVFFGLHPIKYFMSAASSIFTARHSNCNFMDTSLTNAILTVTTNSLYFAQYWLMWLILFNRLKSVFNQAVALQLSGCTVIIFNVIFILTIILGVCYEILLFTLLYHGVLHQWLSLVVAGCTLLSVSFSTWLTFLFVHKLTTILINKQSDSQRGKDIMNNHLLSAIAKLSILSLVSTLSLLLYGVVGFVILVSWHSIHGAFICWILAAFDAYSNFLCIFLSQTAFKEWYAQICGVCDIKCRQCCSYIVKFRALANENQMAVIIANSSNSNFKRPTSLVGL